MTRPVYVMTIAVSEDGERIALLTKDHGPEELLGKLTFPGGRPESFDASLAHAACRELLEETGLQAEVGAFKLLETDETEKRVLHTFFVACDLSKARTMESEVVVTAHVGSVLQQAAGRLASAYAPNFVQKLNLATPRLAALRATPAASPAAKPVILPCDRPEFRQSLDRSRPLELIEEAEPGMYGRDAMMKLAPNKRAYLHYRYTDTGEVVMVPNMSYNETKEMRADHIRWQAQVREERARSLKEAVPKDWTRWMADRVMERYLTNAKRLREHAERVQAGTVDMDAPWGMVSEESPSLTAAREHEAQQRAAANAPAQSTRRRTP